MTRPVVGAPSGTCPFLGTPSQCGALGRGRPTLHRQNTCSRRVLSHRVQAYQNGDRKDDPAQEASVQIQEAIAESPLPQKTSDTLSYATLVKFCLPTLAIWLIGPCLSLVDTAVVGQKSSTNLAALGPGVLLCDINGYVFTFLAVATTNLMAISIANRNQSQANETLSDAIGIALLFGLVFGAITYIVAPSVLQTMTSSTSTQMVEPASIYVRIRSFGAPAAFIMFVTSAFFLAAWDPITPLFTSILAGVTNLVLDLYLVNVADMGIAGAAIATVFSQVLAATLLVLATYKTLPKWSPIHGWNMRIRWKPPSFKAVKRFLVFAGPICFVLLTKTAMYNRLSSYAAGLGTIQSGANHLTMVIFGIFAVFGDVISQAAQAFMPAVIGTPKTAKNLAKKLFATGSAIGITNAAIAASIILFIPGVFTNNPDVIGLAARLTPMLALALTFHTASLATEGMLMAGRDLGFLVTSYFVNMALVLASLQYVKHQGYGVIGSFLCLVQFQSVRFVLNVSRLVWSPKSPIKSVESLKPWITDEIKAAAAS